MPKSNPTATRKPSRQNSRRRPLIWGTVLLISLAIGGYVTADYYTGLPKDSVPQYVGRESCIKCHQAEADLFNGSHHDMAMAPASAETVLADFNNVQLEHLGVPATMKREGDKYIATTEGPDGKIQDYEVKYTFGVTPLQQYMVELRPPGDSTVSSDEKEISKTVGQIQVLRWSWDTEKKSWFHLDPPDVSDRLAPEDDLHWTGVAQRWNNMCADCHSTDLQKKFDSQTLQYHTTFNEIDVSCEACHGPGSLHVKMAESSSIFWDREFGYGLAKLKGQVETQIQTCAPCHSRRRIIQPGFQPGENYYDHFANQLLTEGIYYADGQVLDEDYVHGSFIQSKMYHKGIGCSDCHNPHSNKLLATGNAVCTNCHAHPAAKYDTVAHHFHKPGTEAAQCVNCHMPTTTYMAVDARRDHSLRVPRPDLSTALKTPNACTGCHLDITKVAEEKRSDLKLYQDWMRIGREGDAEIQAEIERANQWCAEACERWFPESVSRIPHFGQALAAARSGSADASDMLQEMLKQSGAPAPAIARATGLLELSMIDPQTAVSVAATELKDEHPLVRAAAVGVFQFDPQPAHGLRLASSLLNDPVRLVRTEAARVVAGFGAQNLSGGQLQAFDKAFRELREGILADSDRAGSHLTLGYLYEQLGDAKSARKCYEDAIRVEPRVTGARTNLATLLEAIRQQLASGGATDPAILEKLRAEVEGLRTDELPLLARDAGLLPENGAIQYRYGLALYLSGDLEKANSQIEKSVELEPNNTSFLTALALIQEKQKKYEVARQTVEHLIELEPNNPAHRQFLLEIGKR